MRWRGYGIRAAVMLAAAFLGFVVFGGLTEESPKEPGRPHLGGTLNAIASVYAEEGPAAALALAPLALPESAAIAVTFYTQDPASMDALVPALRALDIHPQYPGEDYFSAYVPVQHLVTISQFPGNWDVEADIPPRPASPLPQR